MSKVEIRKCADDTPWLRAMENLFTRIQDRAFSLFEQRGETHGKDIEDWLAAERALLWTPPAELNETESEFRLKVAVPGFDEKDLDVSATPTEIIIRAEAARETSSEGSSTVFSELAERTLLRKLPLPSTIDVNQMTANLHKGMLTITARKASAKPLTIATAA